LAEEKGGQLMTKVIFFASIREEVGCDELNLSLGDDSHLADIISKVAEDHGEHCRAVLTAENVKIAVNQELITGNPVISNGDEVAFLPPVTGG
jgi:molybdopterin synthase sulfur carrier subunit